MSSIFAECEVGLGLHSNTVVRPPQFWRHDVCVILKRQIEKKSNSEQTIIIEQTVIINTLTRTNKTLKIKPSSLLRHKTKTLGVHV